MTSSRRATRARLHASAHTPRAVAIQFVLRFEFTQLSHHRGIGVGNPAPWGSGVSCRNDAGRYYPTGRARPQAAVRMAMIRSNWGQFFLPVLRQRHTECSGFFTFLWNGCELFWNNFRFIRNFG